MAENKKVTSYVCEVTKEQSDQVRDILERQGWEFKPLQYTHWKAQHDKTTIVSYLSGKFTVQGKGTAEFVTFTLEPEVLKIASFGYEDEIAEVEQEKRGPFIAHAGIDESGKGDFFGPLCICCAYVDETMEFKLEKLGVKDSKAVKSDKKIATLAAGIRKILRGKYAVVSIGNESYNRMYDNIKNLNKLLAWGHARSLESLLEKVPECRSVLADKFGNERFIKNALMEKGKQIEVRQETKAESDIAVAAASILARDKFVTAMKDLEEKSGLTLPKGASTAVQEAGVKLVRKFGADELGKYAKMHFKTADKVLDLAGA